MVSGGGVEEREWGRQVEEGGDRGAEEREVEEGGVEEGDRMQYKNQLLFYPLLLSFFRSFVSPSLIYLLLCTPLLLRLFTSTPLFPSNTSTPSTNTSPLRIMKYLSWR